MTIGFVTYDVKTHCPHCKGQINLNSEPYVDSENDEFELSEDELGGELFGSVNKPARWSGFEINYKCCLCNKPFTLTSLEI